MTARSAIAKLEAHHTATKEWAERLHVPAHKIDDMPTMLMNKFWHQYNSNVPENSVFHKILREKMSGVDGSNRPEILRRLESAYKQFEGLDETDAAPDVWIVTRAWLDRNMP
jgi:hypothetical protein